MYIVDRNSLDAALRRQGFDSYSELAKKLGLHRNTVGAYLAGQSVFPDALEKIFRALNLSPADAIREKIEIDPRLQTLAPVVDRLSSKFPKVTFVLFGSRARGKHHKYSDFDIGVYKAGEMTHEEYQAMVREKDKIEEDLPFFIDLVNLNRADSDFLDSIKKDWIFLTGPLQGQIELQRKAQDSGEG